MESRTLTHLAPHRVEAQPPILPDDLLTIQRIKNEVAMRLLQTWLADESGYDEEAWALVKKNLEDNKLSNRKRFDE